MTSSAIPIYKKHTSLSDYYHQKIMNDSQNYINPNKYIHQLSTQLSSINLHALNEKIEIQSNLKNNIQQRYDTIKEQYTTINTLLTKLKSHSKTLNCNQLNTIVYLEHVFKGINLKHEIIKLESLKHQIITNQNEKNELDEIENRLECELKEVSRELSGYQECGGLMGCVEEYSRLVEKIEITRDDLKLITQT